MKPAKPLTHDLLRDVLTTVGAPLLNVAISALIDGVFDAYLSLPYDKTVSSRLSDAITLAIRAGAPILVNADLLDGAGVALPATTSPDL